MGVWTQCAVIIREMNPAPQWCCEFQQETKQSLDFWVGSIFSLKDSEVCFFFFLPLKLNELAVMRVNRPTEICQSSLCHAGSYNLTSNSEILCLLRSLRTEYLKRLSADDSQHDGHTVHDCIWRITATPSSSHHYRCEMAAVWWGLDAKTTW